MIEVKDVQQKISLTHSEIRPETERGEVIQQVAITADEVIIMGVPAQAQDVALEESRHNCDAMGCGLAHVLARISFEAMIMTKTIIDDSPEEIRKRVANVGFRFISPEAASRAPMFKEKTI